MHSHTCVFVYDFTVLIACNCLVYVRICELPKILPYFSPIDRICFKHVMQEKYW